MTETNISTARVPQVTVIDPRIPEKAKLRVAAYARVSSDSEDQVNSYIAQVDFYSKHIAGKEDWEMVDIYADEGISGLEARNRDDFNRMMADCRECALPGFVDSKNEEKTERNAGYLVVSHSGGGMLRQGTRKGIRRTPANRGMRAHWVVKGLDISEDVCHGMCP